MNGSPRFVRIPTLKTVEMFREHVARLGIELPCEDSVTTGAHSPLAGRVEGFTLNGKVPGNRFAIHPMEGWDGTVAGGITDSVLRRWQRFGQSGAKLIFGGEAMAVRPDGRANPNQLIISRANLADLKKLREALLASHRELHGTTNDLILGFQLTHSGRFCKPHDSKRFEPRVAYRHPLLDSRFGVVSDQQVFTDDELDRLVEDYALAARVAWEVGADFVDIKHCHGYILHELLSGFARPGKYGGSFENRTRFLRTVIDAIRADGNPIEIAVRVSAFDFVPFKPDPAISSPGKPGPGVPEDFSGYLPYRFAFGVDELQPTQYHLAEPIRFAKLCAELGVRILNISAGSPYYNPHIQRPAAYPPSDGYQPPEDPLCGVARQIHVARTIRQQVPPCLLTVGTAYSYLQEFLPHVAQYTLSQRWVDFVGIGRMVLSYPDILRDILTGGKLSPRKLCRTFSDCTTAPRNGLASGCYPLDDFYANHPHAEKLKLIKASTSR